MPAPRTIKVFIASPGDLAVERRAFKDLLEELNKGFGDALNIKFEPLGWEDTLAATGRRSQEVINKQIDRCDVFILAMHRRWGQAAPDAKPFSSYTEEEFHRAFDRWKKKPKGKKPQAPEIFVFFKHIDPASMADAGPQLQKVAEADIILLLISDDFMASDYCQNIELPAAMKRRAEAGVDVLPLIIRESAGWKRYEVQWGDKVEGVTLGKLNALPSSGKPVHDWRPADKGWANIAEGIERVVEARNKRAQPRP